MRDVTNEIDGEIRRDKLAGASSNEYLKVLSTCVTSGGLAIVSLEIFDDPNATKGVLLAHADAGRQVQRRLSGVGYEISVGIRN
jgi:hypothetical protein